MLVNNAVVADGNSNGTGKSQADLYKQTIYVALGWQFASSSNPSYPLVIWEGSSYPFFQRQSAMVYTLNSCSQGIQVNARAGKDALDNTVQIDSLTVYQDGKRIGSGTQIGTTTNWSCTLNRSYSNETV